MKYEATLLPGKLSAAYSNGFPETHHMRWNSVAQKGMALCQSGTLCCSEAYVRTAQNSSRLCSAILSYRKARYVPRNGTYRKDPMQSRKWRQATLVSQCFTCKGLQVITTSQQRTQDSCHTQCRAGHSTSEHHSYSQAVPSGHSGEIAVARTAVRLASKLCSVSSNRASS